jgi:hypothetical protein
MLIHRVAAGQLVRLKSKLGLAPGTARSAIGLSEWSAPPTKFQHAHFPQIRPMATAGDAIVDSTWLTRHVVHRGSRERLFDYRTRWECHRGFRKIASVCVAVEVPENAHRLFGKRLGLQLSLSQATRPMRAAIIWDFRLAVRLSEEAVAGHKRAATARALEVRLVP